MSVEITTRKNNKKNPKHTVATVLKKKGTRSVSVYLLMVKLYISRAVVRRVR